MLNPSTSISVGSTCLGSMSTPTSSFTDAANSVRLRRWIGTWPTRRVFRGGVDGGLEVADEGIDVGLVGLLLAGRGHEAAAKLADGLFPDFRILADMAQIQGVHGQASGPVRGVVAFHAVGADEVVKCLAGVRGYRRLAERNRSSYDPKQGHRKYSALHHSRPWV